MKAVLVLVGAEPSVIDLPNDETRAFAKMQSLVGDWLERVRGDRTYFAIHSMLSAADREPIRDTDVYCDEDGQSKDLPPNRAGFVGPFVVVGRNGDSTKIVGLDDDQITRVVAFFTKENP